MQQGYQPQRYQQQPPQRAQRSIWMRLLPWALILAVAAILISLAVKAADNKRVADAVAPYEHVFADNITIDNVRLSGMTAQQAHDALTQLHEERVNSWQLALTYQGHTFITVNYPTLGIQVLSEQINAKLKEAWELTHTGDNHAKLAAIQQLREQPYVAETARSEMSDQTLTAILNDISANIAMQQPMDAQFVQFLPNNTDPFLFQPERDGYRLDVENAKNEILELASAGTSGTYELTPEVIKPQVTVADLRKKYTLRATAQTAISRSSPENRNKNIEVSLGRASGLVLKPGEVFSFNKVAGQRTIKNGYYEADEMVYDDLVTGVGGGVCQSSTTLYQAALMAGLDITYRRTHSAPVGYADPGLDATVYWHMGREIDFKFRNNSGSDIFIAAQVKGTGRNKIAEVRIFGESLGEGVSYKLKPVVVEELMPPFDPIYKLDKNAQHVVYDDEFEVSAKARTGYIVETFLQKVVNGHEVEEPRRVSRDTYQPRAEILWKGVTPRF